MLSLSVYSNISSHLFIRTRFSAIISAAFGSFFHLLIPISFCHEKKNKHGLDWDRGIRNKGLRDGKFRAGVFGLFFVGNLIVCSGSPSA